MWSWHFFMGLQFGVEWYTNNDKDYFIIDLLCLRIQHAEPEVKDNVVDSGKIDIKVK